MESVFASRLVSLPASQPPRANRFIVTLYGDVVEPRGGALWMGSLIDACAQQGISESLVRTAVSRLVSSGHLLGQRIGRRSYYRLSDVAREEFASAARLFYEPIPTSRSWLVGLHMDAAPGRRWAQLGPRSYIAAQLPDEPAPPGAVLVAQTLRMDGDIAEVAAELWPLAELAREYDAFIRLFQPLQRHVAGGGAVPPQEALMLRLQLVHRFRLIVLQDPRLPREALGRHWPGDAARHLFAGIYLALADAADRRVAQTMSDADGALGMRTDAVLRRLEGLRQIIAG